MALILDQERRFNNFFRTLLFLPYAIPGFISILVFKGLFNNNLGEINIVLGALFGNTKKRVCFRSRLMRMRGNLQSPLRRQRY